MKSIRLLIGNRIFRLWSLILSVVFGAAVMSSCINDSFTTSSSDVLSFSTDLVTFDTVFTDLGTPTARLKVYNRAKKSVNISSIRFRKPDSNFTLNVDGVSGTTFKDVEIRGNDSIFIFIECYIPADNSRRPSLVDDDLEFITNGVTQTVRVEAYGQNVIRMRGEVVTGVLELTDELPYVIFDSLVVEKGGVLKIQPGADLLFHDKAKLTVRGRIEATGEPGKMINMRGDRLDNVLPDVSYDILAGQWDGITIARESFGNRMEYVDMRSTVRGIEIDSCGNLDRRKLLLVNSWLHNSQTNALKSSHAKVDAYGCVFSEAAQAVVSLTGGAHDFSQCTFSNYYLFSAISQPLLCLYHLKPEPYAVVEPEMPYMRAQFDNSIFYGLPGDINEGDLDGTEVCLRYCSLKSAGTDDDHFVNCLWNTDPLFYTVRADYYFNYRLKEGSPVIGAGNPDYVNPLTIVDMDGNDRLQYGNPDLGAYVYTGV